MANFYYDCEFLEGKQDKRFLGVKYGETKNMIDLISIGIVSEDNQEYYAISKDFNLKEAWNRYDVAEATTYEKMHGFSGRKVYWIRENVLKPIFREWLYEGHVKAKLLLPELNNNQFTYKKFKKFLENFGKTNKQIAEDVFNFCSGDTLSIEKAKHYNVKYKNINLYGYYSAYDHVCFSWLFGKMIDLPNGFPMYTCDLKQELDRKNILQAEKKRLGFTDLSDLKMHIKYPKQEKEHSAIFDARWNKQFHEFLKRY